MSSLACPLCDQAAGRVVAPGGPIHDDGLWVVNHHTGTHTDPGELIVLLRRHAESLADLTAPEASALGPVLRGAVAAVERLVRPERTYVASYNESVRHVHFFILPRTSALPAGHVVSDLYRKGRMWLRRARLARNPTNPERADAAARLRDDPTWSSPS